MPGQVSFIWVLSATTITLMWRDIVMDTVHVVMKMEFPLENFATDMTYREILGHWHAFIWKKKKVRAFLPLTSHFGLDIRYKTHYSNQ